MNKMDEIILVAPRNEVFEDEKLTFQEVLSNQSKVDRIVRNIANSVSTMRRGDAEENELFKQPIPYIVIKRGGQIFMYERLKGGGEKRLHSQLSLGFGGHMNEVEGLDFNETLYTNTYRELEEELNIQGLLDGKLHTIGLINDDENNVGKVHIGLLGVLELPLGSEVTVRETDQIDGKWISVTQLKDKESVTYKRLESWSQFVADIL